MLLTTTLAVLNLVFVFFTVILSITVSVTLSLVVLCIYVALSGVGLIMLSVSPRFQKKVYDRLRDTFEE